MKVSKPYLYAVVAEYYNRQYTIQQIVSETGTPIELVKSALKYAKEKGLIEIVQIDNVSLRDLNPEIKSWIERITPKGCTAEDVVCAIITDAFYDEEEDKR
jgi:hypothetical protein